MSPAPRNKSTRLAIALIIAVGAALRLWIAPQGAHPGDLPVFTAWGAAWLTEGWAGVYPASTINYPPVGAALVGVSAWVYGLLSGGALPDPASPLWSLCLKLPGILADVGIAWAIVSLTAEKHRPLAALGVMANPALIIMSAWWGQLESLYALGALLALRAAQREHPFAAGTWIALAGLVKLQGWVAAPAVALVVWAASGQKARAAALFALGGLLPVVGAMLPYTLNGQGALVIQRSVALIAGPGWLTVNAPNLWYLVTGGAGNWAFGAPLTITDADPVLWGLSGRAVGTALLALWVGLALWLGWSHRRARGIGWVLAAAMSLGVFFWPTQAHERYAFGAVVWSLPLLTDVRWRWLPLSMMGVHTATLVWAQGGSVAVGVLLGVGHAAVLLAWMLSASRAQ